MLFPWKLLFRFFSAMVLLATGGFAAGHDIPLPFTSPPPATAPAPGSSTTTTTAPPASDGSTTTTTAPDGSTTTTTAPDSTPPVLVTPVPDPAPTTSTTVPAKPTTTTTAPAATPAPGPSEAPPVIPVDDNAGAVCAAAATTTCGPATPVPAPTDTHAARVQRCQDWWNSLAAAFTANNEPQWAAKATQIAGQCDAMITRWEQLVQQWAADHQPKGDHNGDGHPDNGNGPKVDHPAPPVPPQPKPVSRHGEGRH